MYIHQNKFNKEFYIVFISNLIKIETICLKKSFQLIDENYRKKFQKKKIQNYFKYPILKYYKFDDHSLFLNIFYMKKIKIM